MVIVRCQFNERTLDIVTISINYISKPFSNSHHSCFSLNEAFICSTFMAFVLYYRISRWTVCQGVNNAEQACLLFSFSLCGKIAKSESICTAMTFSGIH